MTHRARFITLGLLLAMLALVACGGKATAPVSTSNGNPKPTLPAVNNGEGGGEAGGVEAAFVTYSDTAQGFAIGHPGPWTQDKSITSGVKFVGGDDSLTLAFVTPAAGTDAMTYAQNDVAAVQAAFPGFKQVNLAASTEVKDAIILGFEADGASAVTGKAFTAHNERYYMPLADGRLAILTVVGPDNHYDREGVRDIALSLKVTTPSYAPVIDPTHYVNVVDNPYFPLTPGATFVFEGQTEKGNEHVEVIVLSDTKVIMGVTCVVISDTVAVDGQLEEQTVDWYAQDKQGNVWYFGEDTKEYQGGKVVSTKGSWEAGVNGAQPGIIMEAQPAVGDTYRQEYYQGEAEDMAQVLSLSESATVPYGSYQSLLLIKEWSALDPTIVEQKYYAKGIGFILAQSVQGESGALKLVDIRHK